MNQVKLGCCGKKQIVFVVLVITTMIVIGGCNNKNQTNTSSGSDQTNQKSETPQTMTPVSMTPEASPVVTQEASSNTTNGDNAKDIYIDTDQNNLGALVFLGGGLDKKELEQKKQELLDDYVTNVKDIPFYDYGGPEFFCIIPHYVGSEVTIKRSELSEQGELVEKETLVTTEKPIIVKCNESDLYSNVTIIIDYKDESTTFAPFVSLKDGSVMPADKMDVLDLRKK